MTTTEAKRPLTQLPPRLDAAALVGVLDQLDMLSPDVKKLVAAGTPLRDTAAIAISVAALDEALKTTNLPTDARIKFKMALSAQGLLASADRRVNTLGRL